MVVEPLWADQGDHGVLWMPLSNLSSHAPHMCFSSEVGLPLAPGWPRSRARHVLYVDQLMGNALRPFPGEDVDDRPSRVSAIGSPMKDR